MDKANTDQQAVNQGAIPRISICVITLNRPKSVQRLLEALNLLTFQGTAPAIRIVVVENDDSGQAKAICDGLEGEMRWPLLHQSETRRGIPFARNAAVELGRKDADFLVFIDDDEVPDPSWLEQLLEAQRRFDADVVAGPVLPRFEETPPSWAIRGGFFNRRRYETGTALKHAFTNNILLKTGIFDALTPHFNTQMALTGGSDVHFTRRVALAGYHIIWTDDALVYDCLPASRVSVRWLLKRAYRVGTTTAYNHLSLYPWWRALSFLLWKATYNAIRGVAQLPLSLFGKAWWVRALFDLSTTWGTLAGMLGRRYEEYREIHGE